MGPFFIIRTEEDENFRRRTRNPETGWRFTAEWRCSQSFLSANGPKGRMLRGEGFESSSGQIC